MSGGVIAVCGSSSGLTLVVRMLSAALHHVQKSLFALLIMRHSFFVCPQFHRAYGFCGDHDVKSFFVAMPSFAVPASTSVFNLDDTLAEEDLVPVSGPSGGSHLAQVGVQEESDALRTATCKACKCSSAEDSFFVVFCFDCLTSPMF